ncbi:MAG: hypothetical protein MUF31_12575 [Akkermansiaceae bacterium]|jgi:hypothetical protein|nr:hypothetical protein [Akkermansiaceae bacterium]
MKSVIPFLLGFVLGGTSVCGAQADAEWQWSVPVEPLAERSFESPRAFLWVPPDCGKVRAVIFAQHNMEEIGIMEDPGFRKMLEEEGVAQVWVAPALDLFFRYDQGAGEKFDRMMADLAEESGYEELAAVPWVVMGHSAAASLPWIMAAWRPERMVAGVSISGQFPYVWDGKAMPHMSGAKVGAVPGLMTSGEYEDGEGRAKRGLFVRRDHPEIPFGYLGLPADGHFNITAEKTEFITLWIRKALRYRLPKDGEKKLREIDPQKSGWLTAPYRVGRDPEFPATPVVRFEGEVSEGYWWFDQELAHAAESLQSAQRGKAALLGFEQDGKVVEQVPGTHQQVNLEFRPEEDGRSFSLQGVFIDQVPAGRPETWTGLKAGEGIDVPQVGGPVRIERICGPVRKLDGDRWILEMDRSSHLGDRRGNEAWLAAVWPGGGGWKRAIQQARLAIPVEWKEGREQRIFFEAPDEIDAGVGKLDLVATSDAGLEVGLYVREGPAVMVGRQLVLRPIPKRAKRPVKITVVAWQMGRGAGEKVRTAEPVTRVIEIR